MDLEQDVGETLLSELAFGTGADVFIGEPVTSCLGGLVGGIRAVITGSMGADPRSSELLLAATIRELDGHLLELAYQIDQLLLDSRGECPNATDAFALGSAYAGARARVADDAMRSCLRNALVNAFEPTIYRRGYTLHLYGIVGELIAGDLSYLGRLGQGSRDLDYRSIPAGSQEREHADRLLAARLAHVKGVPDERKAQAVAGDGLLVTELGDLLLELTTDRARTIPGHWQPPWERAGDLLAGIDQRNTTSEK